MTGRGRLLDPADPAWPAALARTRHDVYHLPGYVALDARQLRGRPVAFCYDDGSDVLLLPLVLRDVPGTRLVDATSPYGYSSPVSSAGADRPRFWHEATRSLVTTLAAHGVVAAFVRLHPLLPVPTRPLEAAGWLVHHGETVSVDLRQPWDRIWAQTRRGHRRDIERARRAGLHVVFDDWALLDAWVGVYRASMRRLGADDYYFFRGPYFGDLRGALGDAVHLVVALADDELVGGQLVLEHDGIVQAHLFGARTGCAAPHPGKLVDDEVRRWARDRGDGVYHLGGGYGGADDGLFDYKAGFAPRRHPFRTWRVVVDRDAYAGLAADDDATGFFPAYRRNGGRRNLLPAPRGAPPPVRPPSGAPAGTRGTSGRSSRRPR